MLQQDPVNRNRAPQIPSPEIPSPEIPNPEIPSTVRYTKGGRAKREYSPHLKRWNNLTQRRFLEALAASGNVKWAAKAAGTRDYTAQRHRRTRPEFARAWAEALEHAYMLLEFELVTDARRSVCDFGFPAELAYRPMTASEAIRVLALYKASLSRNGRMAGREALPGTMEDIREDILRKVRAIRNARGASK